MFLHFLQSKQTDRTKFVTGFGLIELMVSISIMVIIMATVMTRQDSFNGTVLLRSQAYEIALQLREVQLSAVSATSRAGEYRTNLGVFFDTSQPNIYRVFQDNDGDLEFDADEQLGQPGVLDRRFEISALRANGSSIAGGELSVVFERPDFDARFFNSSGNEITASDIEIDITRVGATGSGFDVTRTVEVTPTGQITVSGT